MAEKAAAGASSERLEELTKLACEGREAEFQELAALARAGSCGAIQALVQMARGSDKSAQRAIVELIKMAHELVQIAKGDDKGAQRAIVKLIKMAREKAEPAWDGLDELFGERLKGFIRRFGLQQADADNLAQDTWVRVKNRLELYDQAKGDFWTWLSTIARNLVWDYLRRSQHGPKVKPELPLVGPNSVDRSPVDDEPVDPGEPPVEIVDRRILFAEMFRLLARCGGYPHQQLSFLLLAETRSPGCHANSTEVAQDEGNTTLSRLLVEWRDRNASASDSPLHWGQETEESLVPMRVRLALKLCELFVDDRASRRGREGILSKVVGETTLAEYANRPEELATSITQWASDVKGRIRRRLDNPLGACQKCTLRNVQPCQKAADSAGEAACKQA